jgi:hypothetical protein
LRLPFAVRTRGTVELLLKPCHLTLLRLPLALGFFQLGATLLQLCRELVNLSSQEKMLAIKNNWQRGAHIASAHVRVRLWAHQNTFWH